MDFVDPEQARMAMQQLGAAGVEPVAYGSADTPDYAAALQQLQGGYAAPVAPAAAPIVAPPDAQAQLPQDADPEAGFVEQLPLEVEQVAEENAPDPLTPEGARELVATQQGAAVDSAAREVQALDDAEAKRLEHAAVREHDLQAAAQQAIDRNNAFADDIARRQQEYDQLAKEIGSAEIVDRRTTGQQVMGLIATAIAGIADAVGALGGHKGDNVKRVTDAIDLMVDRDMALQKDAIARKGRVLDKKGQALQLARQTFLDQRAADEFVLQIRRQIYAEQTANVASYLQNAQQRELVMRGALATRQDAMDRMRKIAMEDLQMRAAEQQLQMRDQQMRLQRQAARGAGRDFSQMSETQLRALDQAGMLPFKYQQDLRKMDQDVAERQGKARAELAKSDALMRDLSRLDSMLETGEGTAASGPLAGRVLPNVTAAQREVAELKRAGFFAAKRALWGTAEPSPSIAEDVRLTFGMSDTSTPEETRRGIRRLRAAMRDSREAARMRAGLEEGMTVPDQTPPAPVRFTPDG